MANAQELPPKRTGLESKSREELEALWDKAENTGYAGGFAQGHIADALTSLAQREVLASLANPSLDEQSATANAPTPPEEEKEGNLPGAGLPFKDEFGRVQNLNTLKIRQDGLAAHRKKYPGLTKKPKN